MERHPSTLDALVAALRRRHGPRAAAWGADLPPPCPTPVLPTGLPALDEALPGGGLPRGALTEVVAAPSSGSTTLALMAVARAQGMGDLACWLDLGRSFAPGAAVAAGVDLASLAVARPAGGAEAATVIHTLLARRAVGALVVDSLPRWAALSGGPAPLAALWRRLPRLLEGSGCAVIVLSPLPSGLLPEPARASGHALGRVAALRLRLEHAGWLRRGPAIVGCQVEVGIQTAPFADPLARVTLALGFAGQGPGAEATEVTP